MVRGARRLAGMLHGVRRSHKGVWRHGGLKYSSVIRDAKNARCYCGCHRGDIGADLLQQTPPTTKTNAT